MLLINNFRLSSSDGSIFVIKASLLCLSPSTFFLKAELFSFNSSCTFKNFWVPNIFLKIGSLSLLSASKSFLNSPCGSITICLNWLAFNPKIFSISLSASVVFVITLSSSIISSTACFFSVVLIVPFLSSFSTVCVGYLVILYSLPLAKKSNSTYETSVPFAWWLFNDSIVLLPPLASPKSANEIASKIVVFPAPVGPEITKILLPFIFVKSNSSFPA